MTSLELLKKDDLKLLIGCFSDDFLREPLLRPAKTLKGYIPNGFRPNKLKRNQMEKIYVEALSDGEPSVTDYVLTNINKSVDTDKVGSIIGQIKDKETEKDTAIIVSNLSTILWPNHIKLPAYIVMLLHGVDCPKDVKDASLEAFNMFFETIDKTSDAAYSAGLERGKKTYENALQNEQKTVARLRKSVDEAHKARDVKENDKRKLCKENEKLQTELAGAEQNIKEKEELIDRIEQRVKQLEHEISKKRAIEDKNAELEKSIIELKDENNSKEQHISQIMTDLTRAKEEAYSETVIQRICAEIIDEIQASTVSQEEVLQIAKNKFSDSDTIYESWSVMSTESDDGIKAIIKDLEEDSIADTHLDIIEHIEDNELIKFAVIKSLRAVIYDSLERRERNRELADRFLGEATNEE